MTTFGKMNMLWVVPLAWIGLGCGVQPWEGTDGAEEVELAQDESALLAEETENADEESVGCSDLGPEALAQLAAARAPQRFHPSGCVQATAQGASVTYQLKGCTGRFGVAEATGVLTSTFSRDAQGLHVQVVGDDLTLRRAVMDVDAKATCRVVSGTRQWMVVSVGEGTGFRGARLSHRGDYTVRVDPAAGCREVDGKWTQRAVVRAEQRAAERVLAVNDLVRCRGACPKAGGVVELQRFNGQTLTVTFDGSSTARWSTSKGDSGTRPLRCGP